MEGAVSFETLVSTYLPKIRQISEDSNLNINSAHYKYFIIQNLVHFPSPIKKPNKIITLHKTIVSQVACILLSDAEKPKFQWKTLEKMKKSLGNREEM